MRIIINSFYEAPAEHLLKSLGLPSVNKMAHQKSASMVYKAVNNQAPIYLTTIFNRVKVKIDPYTFVRRGVSVREDTYAEPSACEVGWPIPFLAAFISPVFQLDTHLLLGKQ